MNLRRILNALSEQTDPIMDIPGETFTSGPFEGQPKVAGKLDILRDNEPYVGEVDGDDMFPIDEDGDGQLDLPGEPCPPGSPCAEEHCPDSPSGCNVDSSGNVYTLQEVPIPGTPPPGTWMVLVLTTPDGEQYAYTGANPAYPDGGGWFMIIDGELSGVAPNPNVTGGYMLWYNGTWYYPNTNIDGFNFPYGPWVGPDGSRIPDSNSPILNPNVWTLNFSKPDQPQQNTFYVRPMTPFGDDGEWGVEFGISLPLPGGDHGHWEQHLEAWDGIAQWFWEQYGYIPTPVPSGYEPGPWYDGEWPPAEDEVG